MKEERERENILYIFFLFSRSLINIRLVDAARDNILSGVDFTNILRAAFAPNFLCQKSTNLQCKFKKAVRKIFEQNAAC
jgi:hypothetical protein